MALRIWALRLLVEWLKELQSLKGGTPLYFSTDFDERSG
jgi:hypothetical protein